MKRILTKEATPPPSLSLSPLMAEYTKWNKSPFRKVSFTAFLLDLTVQKAHFSPALLLLICFLYHLFLSLGPMGTSCRYCEPSLSTSQPFSVFCPLSFFKFCFVLFFTWNDFSFPHKKRTVLATQIRQFLTKPKYCR